MSMTLSEASAEANKFSAIVRALGKLQETAESLVAFDQLARERAEAVEKLSVEVAETTAQLEAIRADAAQAKADAADAAKIAVQKLSDRLESMQKKADDALAAAREVLDATLRETQEAQSAANVARDDLTVARAELDAVLTKIAEAKADALKRFGV